MSDANFKRAFEKAMSYETAGGGQTYLDDPRVQAGDISTRELQKKCGYSDGKWDYITNKPSVDRGGETKFGVAQNSHPNVVVRALTLAQAEDIYKKGYWNACRCDELSDDVARYIFDIACGSGPGEAIRMLQQAVGVTVDGSLGPKTMAAALSVNQKVLLSNLVRMRNDFYKSIAVGKQAIYLNGWLKRANDLR